MTHQAIRKLNEELTRDTAVPDFAIGDSVRVHTRIHEGGKDRIQVFAGTVIGRSGSGGTETFTVRRISHGVGVEKVLPVHSPSIARIEVGGSGHVRRAKLYYLRQRTGRKSRLREKIK